MWIWETNTKRCTGSIWPGSRRNVQGSTCTVHRLCKGAEAQVRGSGRCQCKVLVVALVTIQAAH